MRFAHEFMDADATVFRNFCQRHIVTGFRLNTEMDRDPKDMTFAERVKHYREGLKMTQAELAEFAELTPGAVGDIESGRSKSTPAIDLIAEALKISTKMLRYGVDHHPSRYAKDSLSTRESRLIDAYRQLTGTAQIRLDAYIDGLPKRSLGKNVNVGDRPVARARVTRDRRSG